MKMVHLYVFIKIYDYLPKESSCTYYLFLQMGKIIPFNVVIDNIIQLNSQAQNELQIVKEELQKYKCLELSPKQEQQLHSLVSNFFILKVFAYFCKFFSVSILLLTGK